MNTLLLCTHLIISEPDFAIKNFEVKHMIHKWFTFWVVIRSRKYLDSERERNNYCEKLTILQVMWIRCEIELQRLTTCICSLVVSNYNLLETEVKKVPYIF